jgi:PAS domain-containing protein
MKEGETTERGSPNVAELRRKAEQHLNRRSVRPALSETDARALVHELQVHQIELEMQNEELLRAQAAAQAALERYQDLFDFNPMAYFLWDQHGRILEVNLAGAALLGLNRDAVIHKRFGQLISAGEHWQPTPSRPVRSMSGRTGRRSVPSSRASAP